MKLTTDRPYADPEKAARRIVEIASTIGRCKTDASISSWSTGRFCFAIRQSGRVRRGHDARYRARLVDDARELHFRSVHTGRC